MKQAIITVGMGFGDEGKGATVDYLCREFNADLVVRYSGGPQCGHNVELPDGRRHTFSQFGSGTLVGVPTYCTKEVIIDPLALRRESDSLHEVFEIRDPMVYWSAHPKCLVSTVFHQEVNRIRERARCENKHGSCGRGVGETRSYRLKHGNDAPVVGDLKNNLVVLEDKLQLLRERSLQDVQELDLSDASGKLFDLSVKEEARRLYSIGYLNNDLPHCKTAIFEGAQGILLDEWRGFHPYTTWSTVTPEAALDLAAEYGAEVLVLGVTRAYMTRHGAGPFPTEWKISTLEDKGNPYNEWQGDLRCGWLDFALLEYALSVCKIDGWAVNCLDDLRDVVPYVNMRYGGYQLKAPALPSLKAQEHMTRELKHVKTELFPTTVSNILGQLEGMAPVLVKSNGPTHKHRTMSKLPPFRRVKSA